MFLKTRFFSPWEEENCQSENKMPVFFPSETETEDTRQVWIRSESAKLRNSRLKMRCVNTQSSQNRRTSFLEIVNTYMPFTFEMVWKSQCISWCHDLSIFKKWFPNWELVTCDFSFQSCPRSWFNQLCSVISAERQIWCTYSLEAVVGASPFDNG